MVHVCSFKELVYCICMCGFVSKSWTYMYRKLSITLNVGFVAAHETCIPLFECTAVGDAYIHVNMHYKGVCLCAVVSPQQVGVCCPAILLFVVSTCTDSYQDQIWPLFHIHVYRL